MRTENNNQSVIVVGLGYVGLPLAVLAQEKGWQVTGIDIDENKVSKINNQEAPFTDDQLSADLQQYPITATTDFSTIQDSAIIIVAVPTPVTTSNEPDLTPLQSAISSIKPHLQAGQVISVESTINPGVMDEIIVPLLEDTPDVHLVHCPERVNPGDTKWSVRNIPRVLGGYSQGGTDVALNFYQSVLEAPVKVMGSATEAEAVKILENTFRDINIAYINEMARSFDALGIDITNVIAGAATKPFAFMPHYPGNGVGGHCISVDPYYMIERGRRAGFDHEFLKLARHINESMPVYTIQLLEHALAKAGKNLTDTPIAILGVSYKKDVSDTRNSPALKIISLLKNQGATIHIFDPFTPEHSTVASLDEALQKSNVAMLACDHTDLVQQLTPEALSNNILAVIDGKNALDIKAIAKANIPYYGIGRRSIPAQ